MEYFSECFSKLLEYNVFNAETTQIRNRRASIQVSLILEAFMSLPLQICQIWFATFNQIFDAYNIFFPHSNNFILGIDYFW